MTVSPRVLYWRYGLLAIPLAFAGLPLYMLAPDYYVLTHGLSLSMLGVLLLVLRLFDGIQDPLIGWFIDRFRSRFKWIWMGSGAMMWGAMTLLFNTVWGPPAVWFLVWMGVSVSAYSVMGIGLGAWASWWTQDPAEQTRLATVREGCALAGIMMAVSAPTVLGLWVPRGQVYGWVSALCGVVLMVAWYALRGLPLPQVTSGGGAMAFWQGIREMSSRTWSVLGATCLSMVASSIPAVLVIFFVRDRLHMPAYLPLFLLLYFISGALGMPLWQSLAIRWGSARAWAWSHAVACVGLVGAFFLGSGDGWWFALVCGCSGVALGADLSMPPVLLAHQTHAMGQTDQSGTHYACLVLVGKLALAMASVVALPMLEAAGFVTQGVNTPRTLLALSMGYAVIPCLIKGCAGWWVWRLAVQTDACDAKGPIVLKA